MFKNLGFQSNNATLDSPFISNTAIIYGPSRIGERSIIDSFVIIGYPTRAKTQQLFAEDTEQIELVENIVNAVVKDSSIVSMRMEHTDDEHTDI